MESPKVQKVSHWLSNLCPAARFGSDPLPESSLLKHLVNHEVQWLASKIARKEITQICMIHISCQKKTWDHEIQIDGESLSLALY